MATASAGSETAMGRVAVPATIESIDDLYRVHRGEIPATAVRRIEVPAALVDTGATTLSMPASMIAALGLLPFKTRRAITSGGPQDFRVFGAARLFVQGRECTCDVTELPDDCPVLIGQVPLELLDFLVDPGRQRLIGNPAHGGEQMIEMF